MMGLFGLCLGQSNDNSRNARILKYDYDDSGKGHYRYGYQSSDGITREESAEIHYPGTKQEFMKVTGLYAYPGPDGVMYEVRYTADDQGFHPEGDHIKVPPFTPWVHHPESDGSDTNEITDSDSGTGEQVLDIVRTTPRPITQYLPSSTPSSTTYLPSSSTTYKPEYTTGGNVLQDVSSSPSPLFASRSNILEDLRPINVANAPSNQKLLSGRPVTNSPPNLQVLSGGALLQTNIANSSPNPQSVSGGNILETTRSAPADAVPNLQLLLADGEMLQALRSAIAANSNPNPQYVVMMGNTLESLKPTITVTSTPNPQSLPDLLESLRSVPATKTVPNPQMLSEENVIENVAAANVPNAMCVQVLPCRVPEQKLQTLESTGSATGSNIVYLPSTNAPPKVDVSVEENLLSTPKPHPELHFHSTAESQTQLRFATPAPPNMMQMMRQARMNKMEPAKMGRFMAPIVAAKK